MKVKEYQGSEISCPQCGGRMHKMPGKINQTITDPHPSDIIFIITFECPRCGNRQHFKEDH